MPDPFDAVLDARSEARYDGSLIELFWDEANDDVGYEITEDDPDA